MKTSYALFDTLLEPVFVVNTNGKVVYCNEPAALIVGLSIRKITRGVKFTDLLQFSESIDALDRLLEISDATPYKEVTFKSCEGNEGKVQITLQPIFDSVGDKNWIIFVRDVTLEERLQKKYRAELEQKEDVIQALEEAKNQLENYSKNLEQMVFERTQELSRLNQTLSALLNSLGQGFFIFDEAGQILDVSSKACETTLETIPNGKKIWDVLKVPKDKVSGIQRWMQTLFMEMLPFEDLAPLGPTHYSHSKNRHIALDYYPLRTAQNKIEGVVVVASDITELVEAQKQAEFEKEHAKMILHLVQNKKEVLRFIQESQDLLQEIQAELQPKKLGSKEKLYRHLHTLKGGAALFSVSAIAKGCHAAESLLSEIHSESPPESFDLLKSQATFIETSFQQFLDETKSILGDAIFNKERLVEISSQKIEGLAHKIALLPNGELLAQELVSATLLEPLDHFLTPYNEVVQKVAEQTGKQVAPLQLSTTNIQILPERYSPLLATLVHAFRNAVDHGIETSDLRLENGKSALGMIEVRARVDLGVPTPQLIIEIQDDGQGVDPNKIREKLSQKGLDVSTKSNNELLQHLFDSQFSTRDEVTAISGRGVGLDAIKIAAEELQGQVWIDSTMGQGTILSVQVPYITVPELLKTKIQAA